MSAGEIPTLPARFVGFFGLLRVYVRGKRFLDHVCITETDDHGAAMRYWTVLDRVRSSWHDMRARAQNEVNFNDRPILLAHPPLRVQ